MNKFGSGFNQPKSWAGIVSPSAPAPTLADKLSAWLRPAAPKQSVFHPIKGGQLPHFSYLSANVQVSARPLRTKTKLWP